MDNRYQIDEDEPKSQIGLWIVAGGLVCLLVGYHTLGKKKDKQRRVVDAVAVSKTANRSTANDVQREPIRWPSFEFDNLLENNPFNPRRVLEDAIGGTSEDKAYVAAVADALDQSREEKQKLRDEFADKLAKAEWKVKLVLKGESGNMAMVGDKIVHEGEELNGYKIIAIHNDGVVVEPLPSDDINPVGKD